MDKRTNTTMFFMRTEIVARYGKDNERDGICKKRVPSLRGKIQYPLERRNVRLND